ncbi:MAG: 4-hydroxy-3-methylbut-2-enyl diphosphate reductase [Parvibaculales bacterium]
MTKRKLNILLAAPRGFCAGVDRAILIVEQALDKYGAPVYVRHEIVHNRYVVDELKKRGAIFVDELDEVPDDAQVVFSAHGVPKSVPAEAQRRALNWLDATCPLVSKVHIEAQRHYEQGHHIILIGHAGHPEVIGTLGQLPDGAIELIETIDDVEKLKITNPDKLAYLTQTTLSVDDTADIIAALKKRFPNIHAPHKEDICYATTNRQQAVKELAEQADGLFIIGAPNSSNSLRLVELGKRLGCHFSELINGIDPLDFAKLENIDTLGISAGASAPETLVQNVIQQLKNQFDCTITEIVTTEENVEFKLPKTLREDMVSAQKGQI